jgi:hypothetical protein
MKNIKEKPTTILGAYVIETYDSTPLWYRHLPDKVKAWVNKKLRTPIRVSAENKNLVMNSTGKGVQLICKALIGSRSNLKITHGRLGTDGTARTETDSDLNIPFAEYFPVTFYSQLANQVTFEIFFSDSNLDNGTYEEIGIYMDTTTTAKFFAASVISPAETKASGEDKQVNYSITVNNT